MYGRWVRASAAAVASWWLVVSAGIASAHGAVGGGFEAPIPLWLLYVGAGGTVAVTAGWLAVGGADRTDRHGARTVTVPFWAGQALRNVGRVLGLFALVAVLATGLAGPQVAAENVATVLFWPVWLKGLGLLAVLVGSPWGVLSPWGTLYAAVSRLEGTPPRLLGAYPDRLGEWPAVVGFALLVGLVENLTTLPRSPRLTAVVVAGYALAMLLGALAYGPAWLRHADVFAVLYRLLGRVAPLSVTAADGGYRLALRAPWVACTRPVTDSSTVAFVVLALYTVSFDGLTETAPFQSAVVAVPTGPTAAAVGLYLGGFGLFLMSYRAAVAVVGRVGGGRRPAAAFAASLLPIAAAYEVAHVYPFVLRNLGTLGVLLTAEAVTVAPVAGLSTGVFWASQVALVVGGHLVAVAAAHLVAVDRYGPAEARRAHLPLVAVMVGYTVCSLWIISQPVVN